MGRVKLLFDDLIGRGPAGRDEPPSRDTPDASGDVAPGEGSKPAGAAGEPGEAAAGSPRRPWWRSWWGRGLLAVAGLAALGGAAVPAWVAWPLPEDVARPTPLAGLVIEDRHGLPLRVVRAATGERGGWVSLGDVDPAVVRAFLAAEDRRFFEHGGHIDFRSGDFEARYPPYHAFSGGIGRINLTAPIS